MARTTAILAFVGLLLLGSVQSIRLAELSSELEELWQSGRSEITESVQSYLTSSGDDDKGPAELLVKYVVPPSEAKDFVEAFRETAKEVNEEEENNLIFTLSKSISDNILHWEYAAWETAEDLKEHIKADHTKRLAKYVYEHDIVIQISPLIKLVEETKKQN